MAASLIALALAWGLTPARSALTPEAELALDRGLHHLYSLDYASARADLRSLIEKDPDNPFGYLFEGGAIWWQSSQEYGLFQDTPTLQGLFEQDIEAAIRKAEPLIHSSDRLQKADGHFVEGMALGTRGQWDLMKGHYLKAYLDGKHALKHLKKVARLDDDYREVDLGLGVFAYQAAHFSGLVARFGGLFGMRGNESRGLELLRSAMERARYASPQAAQFLAMIYIIDKRDWASALAVILKLRATIPESPYFESLELLARWKLGQQQQSLALGPALFAHAKADPRAFNRKLLSLVCGLAAQQCLSNEQASHSLDWLGAALKTTAEPKPPAAPDTLAYLTLLHLYHGYLADAFGKTDEAAADYDWVLKHPDFSDAHMRARKCLENGCPAAELLAYLRALSRENIP